MLADVSERTTAVWETICGEFSANKNTAVPGTDIL